MNLDYNLPNELIAQSFKEPRDSSKLFILQNNHYEHKHFYNIIDYLKKGDVLVINETKVAKKRLIGNKITGAKTEVIIEGEKEGIFNCRVKGGHPKSGNILQFQDNLTAKIIDSNIDHFFLKFNKPIEPYLEKYGHLPFPSYIKKNIKIEERYQTTYAKKGESLAAPTAGLHFTKDLLKKIENKGVKIAKVRLDISFSTFLKVTEEQIKNKILHDEKIEISKKTAETINNRNGRLVVCGTTSLRTLESCYKDGKIIAQKTSTNIFLSPDNKPKLIPELIITNFHLPNSSLLMMIAAYIGEKKILKAYKEAIKHKYRFFSLGDSMLIFN